MVRNVAVIVPETVRWINNQKLAFPFNVRTVYRDGTKKKITYICSQVNQILRAIPELHGGRERGIHLVMPFLHISGVTVEKFLHRMNETISRRKT